MSTFDAFEKAIRDEFEKLGYTPSKAMEYTLDVFRNVDQLKEEQEEMKSSVGRAGEDENYEEAGL